jgi:hypothetical protein
MFPLVEVWSSKGGAKSNFNNLSNKVITLCLKETMTEQNATVSALQLWLLPQLQLHLHVTHRNSLPDATQRYHSRSFSVVHMAVILQNKIKISFQF